MKSPAEINALRALDRPITPRPDADDRIRELIEAAISDDAFDAIPFGVGPFGVGPLGEGPLSDLPDGSPNDLTSPRDQRPRRWRQRLAPWVLAAAALAAIVGWVGTLATGDSDEPIDVVVADVDLDVELSPAERICTGAYTRLAAEWSAVLESPAPGMVISLTPESTSRLVETQVAFVASLRSEIAAGNLDPVADNRTLDAVVASIEETQAVLDRNDFARGPAGAIAAVGATHRYLAQLVEENPLLAASCDVSQVEWPQ